MSESKKTFRKKDGDPSDKEILKLGGDLQNNSEAAILSQEEYAKSKEIIEKNLVGVNHFQLGDLPNFKYPKLKEKYIGGFINADKGILTVGIFIDKKRTFSYAKNNVLAVAYAYAKEFFIVESKIAGVKEIKEKDVNEMVKAQNLPKNQINNFLGMLSSNRFIVVNLCILKEPEKHQRRDHVRVEIKLDIYFKLRDNSKEFSEMAEEWISENKVEMQDGYFKIQTVDISAGGFRSIAGVNIPKETVLDCIIDIHGDKISTEAEIVNCTPSQKHQGSFDIRAKFVNIDKTETDRIAKSITK